MLIFLPVVRRGSETYLVLCGSIRNKSLAMRILLLSGRFLVRRDGTLPTPIAAVLHHTVGMYIEISGIGTGGELTTLACTYYFLPPQVEAIVGYVCYLI